MYYTQCLSLPPLTSIIMDRHKLSKGKVQDCLKIKEGQTIYTTRKKSDHKMLVHF